ncbi:hypothetical protein PILCRDRAFT_137893 [Piloderma croceum F 1598]|uniref:Uncharacterized protein n=1 Tax=Piloderma croceum (strain F 1598) TaxID=765440 RepID=A0A0C3GJA5_PILCF|nr:hypothetical protein PILCRDRAFT_137893 [Piloderma croceum F 1598]
MSSVSRAHLQAPVICLNQIKQVVCSIQEENLSSIRSEMVISIYSSSVIGHRLTRFLQRFARHPVYRVYVKGKFVRSFVKTNNVAVWAAHQPPLAVDSRWPLYYSARPVASAHLY